MPRTAVILLNYDNPSETAGCVQALLRSEVRPALVVVDNASPNRSDIEAAIADYPGAWALHSRTNGGFGKGNNIGLRWAMDRTEAEFFFVLNNDARVEPETIGLLEAALDAHPEAGAAAPRITLLHRPDALWYGPGLIRWWRGGAEVPGMYGPADTERALTPAWAGFVSGCAMLVRREALGDVGGFDPRFFMYEEDVELSLRLRAAGWKLRYEPAAVVRHLEQGSTRRPDEPHAPSYDVSNPNLPFLAYHHTRNRLLNMQIHYRQARGLDRLRLAVGFPAYWGAKAAQFLLHGRTDAVWANGRGIRDFLRDRRLPFYDELSDGALTEAEVVRWSRVPAHGDL